MQCETLSKMHPDLQLALRCWILYRINSISVALFCIDSILLSYVEGKIMRAFLQICAADQESFCLSVNTNTNTNASINRNKNTNTNTNTKTNKIQVQIQEACLQICSTDQESLCLSATSVSSLSPYPPDLTWHTNTQILKTYNTYFKNTIDTKIYLLGHYIRQQVSSIKTPPSP